MPPHYRRMNDLESKYQHHRVSDDITVNQSLPEQVRLSNLENDIILNTSILGLVVKQNEKYAEYLEAMIAREKDALQFWIDIRKKLLTAGIIGAVAILFTVLGLGLKEWITSVGGPLK